MQNKTTGLEISTLGEASAGVNIAPARSQATTHDLQSFQLYEQRLAGAREHFGRHPLLARTATGQVNPLAVECSLIYYCALGAAITEPVEGWIRRAGERCQELGLANLGQVLIRHAKNEAGHQHLMENDTRKLVEHWNKHYFPELDAEYLLTNSLTPGVQQYYDIHEEILAGSAPFAQLAVEYEIERLSIDQGPQLLARFEQLLGPEIKECLSFLEEHVLLDEGHSKLNARQMANLLADHPEYLEVLVAAGEAGLKAYAAFLDDCLRLTQTTMKEAHRR
jgi:hypothetical protein